jgi:6-phosphogluconolactonase
MKGRLEVFASAGELIRGVGEKVGVCIEEAIATHGVASVALSGGSTPRSVYELLGSDVFRERIDWTRVHLFWGDERCVPPFLPESNFRMVNESLIRRNSIPEENIHRILGERPPKEAAHTYEQEIKSIFDLQEGQWPSFSLVLLGLGEDGHTASLFPSTPVLQEQARLVVEVHVEKLSTDRITMTFPLINNASTVMCIVSGRSKANILRQVLEGDIVRYPAQMIDPVSGKLFWLVDHEAASQLQTVHHQ